MKYKNRVKPIKYLYIIASKFFIQLRFYGQRIDAVDFGDNRK